jgi:hypothetical protein
VREYWRFDHTGGRFHDAALAGDVLVDGSYEPLEITHEPDGLIWGHSDVLGLDLCWHEGELRFRDPSTGEFLPTPEEQHAARIEAETQAEQERSGMRPALSRNVPVGLPLRPAPSRNTPAGLPPRPAPSRNRLLG